MMMSEFNALSRKAGFGDCAPHMYDEIEMVYMEIGFLGKEEMVQLYWRHTGLYETLVQQVHEKRRLKAELRSNRERIGATMKKVFPAIGESAKKEVAQ